MPLQQTDIDEFKKLYREDFGEDLSDQEAWAMSERLLKLYRLLDKLHRTDE